LTGRQAADWNAGMVGPGIAELLGIPSISTARNVVINNGKVVVESVNQEGYDVIESTLPALVTVSNESGGLRSIALKEIMAAQKKPITVWTSGQLEIGPQKLNRVKIISLFIPQNKTRCEIVTGSTPDELGANLAFKLKEKKIVG
jgi:electron transfer flavoprotein beta subunit